MKTKNIILLVATFFAGMSLTNSAFSQSESGGPLHDDLLDRLVGHWQVSAVAHGRPADPGFIDAEWVLNHQFLQVHQRGTAHVPGMNTPFEGIYFIGYDHANKRYISHIVCVWGGDDPTEGMLYGSRSGNELKLAYKENQGQRIVTRFIWLPESKSWRINSNMEMAGKEGEPFLEIAVTPASLAGPGNK